VAHAWSEYQLLMKFVCVCGCVKYVGGILVKFDGSVMIEMCKECRTIRDECTLLSRFVILLKAFDSA